MRDPRCRFRAALAAALAAALVAALSGGLAACAHADRRQAAAERSGEAGAGRLARECVPFARAVSGVQLYGNAADWWDKSEGRYARTARPAVGSVLVMERSSRLEHGHLAVVSKVVSGRRILVSHANWVRHRVSTDVPVIDVSETNDWSLVRVWWPPTKTMGLTVYPVEGFILPTGVAAPTRSAAL